MTSSELPLNLATVRLAAAYPAAVRAARVYVAGFVLMITGTLPWLVLSISDWFLAVPALSIPVSAAGVMMAISAVKQLERELDSAGKADAVSAVTIAAFGDLFRRLPPR